MSIKQMQQHVIEQVNAVHDENVLKMLEEELAFYLQNKEATTNLLSEKDLEELIMIANEPIENNTISLNEFKSIMDTWRMK